MEKELAVLAIFNRVSVISGTCNPSNLDEFETRDWEIHDQEQLCYFNKIQKPWKANTFVPVLSRYNIWIYRCNNQSLVLRRSQSSYYSLSCNLLYFLFCIYTQIYFKNTNNTSISKCYKMYNNYKGEKIFIWLYMYEVLSGK